MAGDPKARAKRIVRAAQTQFEREKEAATRTRREAFSQAQREGLTLREIAEEVGLHHSRISQIIEGR